MKRQDKVYSTFCKLFTNDGIDANTIANHLNITRANASHDLNLLCLEGKLYKTNTRPVLFFLNSNYCEVEEKNSLDTLLKNNISLKHSIEQAKAAVLYPPHGMNCLILGETGVGKSMFASLMYDFAISMGIKKSNAPFISFNCADYSNNPELLTSQLFGVVKGAYTGAISDKAGLIEESNEGILFLDEIHRLPPEGQEALFTFLDTNKFRRIGDSKLRESTVLIICATTENPTDALLQTFIRRIPMTITIPPLKDRTIEERLYLIKNFFNCESKRISKDILVSINTMRALLSYNCPNNIGQLKNDIQLLCAKAYSDYLTNQKNNIEITSRALPSYIRKGLLDEKENRLLWNKLLNNKMDFFKFSNIKIYNDEMLNDNNSCSIYTIIESRIEFLKSKGISDITIDNILEKDISKYFNKYIEGINELSYKKNLSNLLGEDFIEFIDSITEFIYKDIGITLTANTYTALALHIDTLLKRVSNHKKIENENLEKIKKLYPMEFSTSLKIKNILEDYINIPIANDEVAYLTLFLVPEESFSIKSNIKPKIIVIAHGKSTATSMANVANTLIGENHAIGINAPLEKSPNDILLVVKNTVKDNFTEGGYLFLVDMGSLATFGDIISNEFNIPVKVISLVSTLHVLVANRKIQLGLSLDAIYNDIKSINENSNIKLTIDIPKLKYKPLSIITTCLTGEGSSLAMKNFLINSLNIDENIIDILPLDCINNDTFTANINKISANSKILFIISSFNLNTNFTVINFSDVFKNLDYIQNKIDVNSTLLNIKSTLYKTIKNLDCNILYDNILKFIDSLEKNFHLILDTDKLICLTLHIAFMINKLTLGNTTPIYNNKDCFISNNYDLYTAIESNIKPLSGYYNISISDDDICYIMNFFISES